MNKPLKCPVCGKRACDVSDIPKEKLYIELKCPNCNHIVKILCDESAVSSKGILPQPYCCLRNAGRNVTTESKT